MRFSITTGCFYPEWGNYVTLPADIITLPDEDFDVAMSKRPNQRVILINGRIVLEDIVKTLEELIEDKCNIVDQMHMEKLYTDVSVEFPTGVKTIQFRNEVDRNNISNTTQAALSAILNGQGSMEFNYRTIDNETQIVTALQLVGIGNQVMYFKQNIVETAWYHKDSLRALTDPLDVINYDITLGW